MWTYRGQIRPPFAEEPGAGQESVWDYPRPPVVRACSRLVVIGEGDLIVARSREALRVLETASPPGYYLPGKDIDWTALVPGPGRSLCEWKGAARYWNLASDPDGPSVGWSYPDPPPRYAELKDHVSFYPGRIPCFVDGERVRPQPGSFYGGWITDDVAGPVKGEPGTGHW